MKKLITLITCLLCTSIIQTTHAAESGFDETVIGIALINQSVNITIEGNNPLRGTESGTGLGLYIESYYDKKYRINGTWSYITYDDFYITGITASADYLVPLNNHISLFAGGALGVALQNYSLQNIDNAAGLVYGVQAGVIAYVSDNLMLELGYRYRPTNLEADVDILPITITVDELNETYLSIILKF